MFNCGVTKNSSATIIVKMLDTFKYTLTPMLYLFICIVIGFTLRRTKILPENSGRVMARLETWVFCPALSFMAMATYFRRDTVAKHATNIVLSVILMSIALVIAIILARVFVPEKCYDRGVYSYALMFGNFGFLGDALVLAIFDASVFSYYKLFSLPLSILCYVWGISILVPKKEGENGIKEIFKKVFNPPTVALLLGIIVGITGAVDYMPEFATMTLDSLKSCMGPVAMLLAGFTVAGYPLKRMLKKKKVYFATVLRLIVLPAVLIAALFGILKLAGLLGITLSYSVLAFAFFAYAAPLGLNTVVFPEAYGGDPETGASMAIISHTLCVITIPVMYTVLTCIFGNIV